MKPACHICFKFSNSEMFIYNMMKRFIGKFRIVLVCVMSLICFHSYSQIHPQIYISNDQKADLLLRLENSKPAKDFVEGLENHVKPYVQRHTEDPEWIISRLQMYWKTKYERVYVNGMDFSHGDGTAPVPTVRFSGSRDWATDYLQPDLEEIIAYMDDERGLYLQNGKKEGKPWEWVHPSETGHIIERINERIIRLAEDAAFLYWLNGDEKYAVFASDIFMKYIEGMYYRDPPLTVGDDKNALLMGLQTFEVIHERIAEHLSICYDFLYSYLKEEDTDMKMIQEVFRKWADQEIKYGVPNNNWNLMQALYITYLALALENDEFYEDGKGQQYYIDQVINQNSFKQKGLRDVVKNYDQETGIWPEVAGYNMLVGNDMLEIYCLMDKTLNNNLLGEFPIVEKANLAIFQYLFPNGFTVAYGDAKHARIRFNALEMLIGQYRKYGRVEKETRITKQLKRFIEDGAYSREKINSLFHLFYYVEDLLDVPAAQSFSELVNPSYYAPNVSWVVQRNGNSVENGMMISKNASLGNHSHTNGVNIELFAKGMVIAPDCAAGVSYWTEDHRDYYSRFAAHNTVVVDGVSDYRNMRGSQAFKVNAIYPSTESNTPLIGDFTFSEVSFTEPSTDARQQRLTGTVRTSESSGYFVDIFRSARNDGRDKKHEYLFHGQGKGLELANFEGMPISMKATDELSSMKGDLKGYDYFNDKKGAVYSGDFVARFSMPSLLKEKLNVNLWMKGYEGRTIFTVEAPYSRAIHPESVPEELYHQPLPTLVVRQTGEAKTRPFVSVIDPFNENEKKNVKSVHYFSPENDDSGFAGITVHSETDRIDYIYNGVNEGIRYIFSDGAFIGSYGVVALETEELQSIFLGKGSLIEKDLWKIETIDHEGSVLVIVDEEDFKIVADQAFTLMLPVSKSTRKILLEVVDDSEGLVFTGKLYKSKKQRVVEFKLPAMENATLKLKY